VKVVLGIALISLGAGLGLHTYDGQGGMHGSAEFWARTMDTAGRAQAAMAGLLVVGGLVLIVLGVVPRKPR